MPMTRRPARAVRGIALMEALVALVVLALGLMGLVASQVRLMSDSRGNAQRAIALSLIDDISNRILINRDFALRGGYDLAWDGTQAASNCVAAACTPAQQAQSDLNLWLAAVERSLPGASATIFRPASDPRQVGIAISWTANETGGTASERAQRLAQLNAATSANGVQCPTGSLCQLGYVQP